MGVLYEQKSYQLLSNFIKKTQRYLKKENINIPICHKILATYKKLYNALHKNDSLEIIRNFEAESEGDRISFDVFSGYRDLSTILIHRIKNHLS